MLAVIILVHVAIICMSFLPDSSEHIFSRSPSVPLSLTHTFFSICNISIYIWWLKRHKVICIFFHNLMGKQHKGMNLVSFVEQVDAYWIIHFSCKFWYSRIWKRPYFYANTKPVFIHNWNSYTDTHTKFCFPDQVEKLAWGKKNLPSNYIPIAIYILLCHFWQFAVCSKIDDCVGGSLPSWWLVKVINIRFIYLLWIGRKRRGNPPL